MVTKHEPKPVVLPAVVRKIRPTIVLTQTAGALLVALTGFVAVVWSAFRVGLGLRVAWRIIQG